MSPVQGDPLGARSMNRRSFLRISALTAGKLTLAPLVASCTAAAPAAEVPTSAATPPPVPSSAPPSPTPSMTSTPLPPFALEEATIARAQAAMTAGQLTARQLVQQYLNRIAALDQAGPQLHAVLETNAEALTLAEALDAERRSTGPRGPLHGIPILLKDNIDTADSMLTTAGSLALLGTRPAQDATVAARLRDAGAILLGKANLSEWANFRSTHSSSGWSARGGQGLNPYALDRSPCGSSSGSASAVAANLAMAALGTETDGSIVCPAHANGVVGIKPTMGLTSRAGVIPLSHSQDSVGPVARTVRDAALVLGAITGVDERDGATSTSAGKLMTDYTRFLDPDGLRGARIGVPRTVYFGYSREVDALIDAAIATMRERGATIVDPANVPTANLIANDPSEFTVMLYEFKSDLAAYLVSRIVDERHPDVPPMRTLADLIAFNEAHTAEEMPFFGQELFEMAQKKGPLSDENYQRSRATGLRIAAVKGLDAVMAEHKLDALVAPTGGPAWKLDLQHGDVFEGGSSSPAAIAGYPLINVPAGFVNGLPIGITFMGRAWSEPMLLKLAYAFEQATRARRPPEFRAAAPTAT